MGDSKTFGIPEAKRLTTTVYSKLGNICSFAWGKGISKDTMRISHGVIANSLHLQQTWFLY